LSVDDQNAGRSGALLTRRVANRFLRRAIPELEQQLNLASQAEMQDFTILRNKVTEEEIEEVVSKWTGIPISKMLDGERDKLLQ
jgi:ATP-dependent Clp protease ATP-binding subunit ClpA